MLAPRDQGWAGPGSTVVKYCDSYGVRFPYTSPGSPGFKSGADTYVWSLAAVFRWRAVGTELSDRKGPYPSVGVL